jgi:Family of unknown function (DUF5682)
MSCDSTRNPYEPIIQDSIKHMSQSISTQSIRLFGIRHHGPGSARSLVHALHAYAPDAVLVEGPPDAEAVLPLLAHPDMRPPVALLIYAPEEPRRAVYYPFAEFSPEWQALKYAFQNKIAAQFIDLPQRFQLGQQQPQPIIIPSDTAPEEIPLVLQPERDPIGVLALAAGYSDSERWWEHMVEQRQSSAGLFEAILEAMAARREATPFEQPVVEQQREAWMRTTLRSVVQAGYQRIAVVCGAWHTPALVDLSDVAGDQALLAGLVEYDVQTTWVPWTYGRLSVQSGYGAGVESPGWYEHLWQASLTGQQATAVAIHWMTRIARLLRSQQLDASSAHIIEAVRLAESLATLRERPVPGLLELIEAAQSVFWSGSSLPMQLIHEQLIVGEQLGEVPPTTPLAPLQSDLASLQKRLRMAAEASWRNYDLDLRKPFDLERSQVLHRLTILGIGWGQLQSSGVGKGTFHEIWRLEWQPELAVRVIEAGIWGNTIADAAEAWIVHHATHAADLPTLTKLVHQALVAEIPNAVSTLMARIESEAAISSDIAHLMQALPPLAQVLRYGNVRNTDTQAIAHVIQGLVTRMCIGLPGACVSVNDEAAEGMYNLIAGSDDALRLLASANLLTPWHAALQILANRQSCHGLLAGRAVRILLDATIVELEQATRYLSVALSTASDPTQAAAWIEGFIRGSGDILVHDARLWQLIDTWMLNLDQAMFLQIVPLLRRTFASFSAPERRALGERARLVGASAGIRLQPAELAEQDVELGEAALGVVAIVLGLGHTGSSRHTHLGGHTDPPLA